MLHKAFLMPQTTFEYFIEWFSFFELYKKKTVPPKVGRHAPLWEYDDINLQSSFC